MNAGSIMSCFWGAGVCPEKEDLADSGIWLEGAGIWLEDGGGCPLFSAIIAPRADTWKWKSS